MGRFFRNSYDPREDEARRTAYAANVVRFRTDVNEVKILLEAVQRLDDSGLGTSRYAISELLDGLNYGYDVIHKVLNTDYGYMKSSAQQKVLRSEFRNLPSASVDGLISAVERGEIYKLIIACDVTLDM